eukprot:CAMPEP_0114346356 /NCGR_PEP_ID=MMETSP0101-20121206/12993_1 /TAXON_ID=38822 ORGANISM="Pteridomonas danica, Strain PT" /NCGR_SAMPLE_ID=MMETSP0101 /ASSEMBLY_ACC=CAM_ASM_000211 /LENGTH=36 /DNA_ID= /DNA_START= /DNA_END= /DNA_ORIENTATION=
MTIIIKTMIFFLLKLTVNGYHHIKKNPLYGLKELHH